MGNNTNRIFYTMAIKHSQSGLTVIEVVAVIAIFALISTVLFVNFSKFTTNVSLKNLTQEIALMIRKSQTYATGIHNIDGVAVASSAFPAYGMSFSVATSGGTYAPTNKKFVLFADVANSSGQTNRFYNNDNTRCGDPATGKECVEMFGITSTDKIVQLCTDAGCTTTGTVNVVFRRPIPDAEICVVSGSSCGALRSFLKIVIESAKGTQRSVTVWNTGQIAVE